MATITLKQGPAPTLDITGIAVKAKDNWIRGHRRRMSFRELINGSVPWWLILVALVFYALSAPHTAAIFDRLTPGWGWLAPIGVEFGLLYAAFRRKHIAKTDDKIPSSLEWLERLLFFTAIVVNGAGALVAVVTGTQLAQMSFAEIMTGLGALPIISQAGLILVPISALIIPIGAIVAGSGLATLVFEGRDDRALLEQEWLKVANSETVKALCAYFIRSGIPANDAQRKAVAEVKNMMLAEHKIANVDLSEQSQRNSTGQSTRNSAGKSYTKDMTAYPRALEYARAHENAKGADLVREGFSKSTAFAAVAQVKKERAEGISNEPTN